MTKILLPTLTFKLYAILGAWVVSLGLVVWLFVRHAEDMPVITLINPNTTTVQVEKIVPNQVVKYVKDTVEVNRLLDENKKLKIQVTALSESIAQYVATGNGSIVMVPSNEVPPDLIPRPNVTPSAPLFTFKDFRLNFVSDGVAAKYNLTQKFEILTSTGKNQAGVPVMTVKLFEVTPTAKLPVSDVITTAIFADPSRPKWKIRPTIQGGIALTQDAKADRINGGVVGVQWLKYGSSQATQDIKYAALTPVVFGSETLREMGLLPFSYNLGSIKHQPFTNLWVSPYVGLDVNKKSITRGGLTVTATF